MSEYTENLDLFKYTQEDINTAFDYKVALNANWDKIDEAVANLALPDQTDNAGKFLTTNGTVPSWTDVKSGASRNIGEIVASTIPLTDAGLHLLDGSLIQGDGIYSAFVDYIAELYADNPTASYFAQGNTTVAYNFDITGNLTNDNGILSNFANNVYASLPNAWISENYDTWEMVFDITTGSDISSQQFIYSNFYNSSGTYSGVNYEIDLSKFKLELRIGSGSSAHTGTYTVLPNTHYLIRIKFTGSAYTLEYSTDNGLTWITDINYASTTKVTTRSEGYFIIGGLYYQYHSEVLSPFYGSINLNNSYIKVNNSVFWEGVTVTGFTPEQEWQQSITDYGVCGKFVYDSTNNTVRLPKYNSKIYTGGGTTPVVGNGTALGITDGSINAGLIGSGAWQLGSNENAYGLLYGTSCTGGSNLGNNITVGVTTDPTKSGVIAQLSNITTSLDGYYYIVIATSTKTDIQVDIDEVTTDLNGKVDKSDLSEIQCVVETYQNGTSWYRVYSDGWCEQGGYTTTNGTYAISLLKTMKDTNYSISLIESSNGTNNPAGSQNSIPIKGSCTTNSIYVSINGSSGLGAYWEVKGYIEV